MAEKFDKMVIYFFNGNMSHHSLNTREYAGDPALEELFKAAHAKGYMSLKDLDTYLPDEDEEEGALLVNKIILGLDEAGLDFLDDYTEDNSSRKMPRKKKAIDSHPKPSISSMDASRMYFSQMGEIPLLSREKEIFLA